MRSNSPSVPGRDSEKILIRGRAAVLQPRDKAENKASEPSSAEAPGPRVRLDSPLPADTPLLVSERRDL